jgi:hypothetical protein
MTTVVASSGSAALSGVTSASATLRISLSAPVGARVNKIVVALPAPLHFSLSAARLARELSVQSSSGGKLRFSASIQSGKLVIVLKSTARSVRVTVHGVAVPGKITKGVLHRHAPRLIVSVTCSYTPSVAADHDRLTLRVS